MHTQSNLSLPLGRTVLRLAARNLMRRASSNRRNLTFYSVSRGGPLSRSFLRVTTIAEVEAWLREYLRNACSTPIPRVLKVIELRGRRRGRGTEIGCWVIIRKRIFIDHDRSLLMCEDFYEKNHHQTLDVYANSEFFFREGGETKVYSIFIICGRFENAGIHGLHIVYKTCYNI